MILEPVTPRLERRCRATVEIAPPLVVGDTPAGRRRIIPITGGRVEGPRLTGEVLPGGADCQLVRADGAAELEARYTVRTAYAWLNDLVAVGSAVRRPARSSWTSTRWPSPPPARRTQWRERA